MTAMIEFFGELIPAEEFWTDEPFGEGWEEDYDNYFKTFEEEEENQLYSSIRKMKKLKKERKN